MVGTFCSYNFFSGKAILNIFHDDVVIAVTACRFQYPELLLFPVRLLIVVLRC